ncbi:outer membrane protein assembly factor BamB [Pleionea sp. CnH1-48]|uniref:outer membrane protein assembly factor BamB n=1 Tax=Pleionea sp. CnH1-48 TaxID=2954494 RepID=UPI002097A29C|nr:outer membrane protein assembly factor BamB [Pleionea sp. CnH1-48]MCO7227444.1 outer membrane protein assembly factor BamB [Pleionea sp. CnH1-48]
MNWKTLSALLVASSLLLTGCGADEDELVPNPLPEIEATVEFEKVWDISVGSGVDERLLKLSPAYGYNKIYAADVDGVVKAINPENGDTVWERELEADISGGVSVGNLHVAVGTRDGQIILLDAETGEDKWQAQTSSEIISAPAIDDGYVVVRTVDGMIYTYAVDSGERQWFYDKTLPSLTLRGTSAPVISRGAAISGFANGKVGVFLLDGGRLAWEKQISAPSGRSELERIVDVDAQPLVFGSTLYAASYNGNVISIELRSGETLWQRELSTFRDMSIHSQLLLVAHDNSYVSALNRNSGAILWTQKDLFLRNLSKPVAFGGHVVVGDYEGYLHILDKDTGQLIGQESVSSSGIIANPLVLDDKLVILTRDGDLIAYKKQS